MNDTFYLLLIWLQLLTLTVLIIRLSDIYNNYCLLVTRNFNICYDYC